MPYTVDDPGQCRRCATPASTRSSPTLAGWNARYEQGRDAVPARAEVLAPAAGARLERGDAVAIAIAVGGARDVAVTLDGEPVAEGAVVRADQLALGTHVVAVTADGETGEAEFEVVASQRGLAHLVATAPRLDESLRPRLLRDPGPRVGRVIALAERCETALGGHHLVTPSGGGQSVAIHRPSPVTVLGASSSRP